MKNSEPFRFSKNIFQIFFIRCFRFGQGGHGRAKTSLS